MLVTEHSAQLSWPKSGDVLVSPTLDVVVNWFSGLIGSGLDNVLKDLVSFQKSSLAFHVSQHGFLTESEAAAEELSGLSPSMSGQEGCFQKLIIFGLIPYPIARARSKISCP